MADFFSSFLTYVSPIELIVILLAKALEVALDTLRMILVAKGYRREATALAFTKTMLWVFVASRVIMGLAAAPIKGIVYSTGYAIGVYLGSRLENYIALGRVLIQAIVSKDNSENLIEDLRRKGYGVTIMEAKGRDSDKQVLMIFANRKGKDEISADIHKHDNTAMITTNDISALRGGTIATSKKLFLP
jgi:uncharacterized protein YebE (UPF0316 family)